MGRKRKKRQWRKSESTEHINEALREVSKVSTINAKADKELFFVDNKRARVKSVAATKVVVPKQKKQKRTQPIHHRQKNTNKSLPAQETEILFDLWDTAPTKVEKRHAKRSKDETTSVVPAVEFSAGSSYHPDEELRKKTVAVEAAMVMEREDKAAAIKAMREADRKRTAYFAAQTSNDNDAAESSGEEDPESGTENTPLPEGIYKLSRSKRSKLTVAQRNKLKRGRHTHGHRRQQQKNETFLRQIDRVKSIKKTITREETEKRSKTARLNNIKRQTKADPNSVVAKRGGKAFVMVSEPAVVIEDEVNGGMRRLPVKGSVVRDRMHSMLRRNKFQMGKRGGKQSQRKGHKKQVGPERWGIKALVQSKQKQKQFGS